ncbi:MAG TPA: hypothetical protein VMS11_05470 [Solirubrobacterales bacterium]|nr:hypothetical protein [Solirubrobacterales bacterium]
MTDLTQITAAAVDIPPPELHEAVVHDDATALGEEVRCVVPGFDPLRATDPMPWEPRAGAEGLFFPKQGDRALISQHVDGTPLILWWEPSATVPDTAFGAGADLKANGLGVIVHGGTGATKRGTDFAQYIWIGTATPLNAADHDIWINA